MASHATEALTPPAPPSLTGTPTGSVVHPVVSSAPEPAARHRSRAVTDVAFPAGGAAAATRNRFTDFAPCTGEDNAAAP